MKTFLIALALLALSWTLSPSAARAAEETVSLGGMKVTVWGAGAEPRPVVLFSHGFHGCATQSRFLMEALARAGYVVFAPNHADAACGDGSASRLSRPEQPFRKPEEWTEVTYRDRADDIRRLLEALRTDARFRDRVDLGRLGLIGHSLGGYTVLGLAGAWPGWRLDGVKAVLALSPYAQPFEARGTLAGLGTPVMYQTGTRDGAIARALRKPGGGYDQSPAPKYYLEFDGAAHFAWTDVGLRAHEAIAAASVAFLDRYVAGRAASPALTNPQGAAAFAYESELGKRDSRQRR